MNTWKLSENEKEKAIQNIVRQGVISPMDKIKELCHAGKVCSFRILFFGVEDCIFLGMLLTVCLWLFWVEFNTRNILCTVFALSPFAYVSCYVLTTWKEHLVQLYEIKMSCRYTLRQVIALRMIYLSFANMLLNTIVLTFVVQTQTILPFWKTLGLSFSSLFLYGVLMLFFQIKGHIGLSVAIPSVVWGLGNWILSVSYGNRVEKLLLNLTDTLVWMIVSGLLIAYLIFFYRFFTTSYKEKYRNVIA